MPINYKNSSFDVDSVTAISQGTTTVYPDSPQPEYFIPVKYGTNKILYLQPPRPVVAPFHFPPDATTCNVYWYFATLNNSVEPTTTTLSTLNKQTITATPQNSFYPYYETELSPNNPIKQNGKGFIKWPYHVIETIDYFAVLVIMDGPTLYGTYNYTMYTAVFRKSDDSFVSHNVQSIEEVGGSDSRSIVNSPSLSISWSDNQLNTAFFKKISSNNVGWGIFDRTLNCLDTTTGIYTPKLNYYSWVLDNTTGIVNRTNTNLVNTGNITYNLQTLAVGFEAATTSADISLSTSSGNTFTPQLNVSSGTLTMYMSIVMNTVTTTNHQISLNQAMVFNIPGLTANYISQKNQNFLEFNASLVATNNANVIPITNTAPTNVSALNSIYNNFLNNWEIYGQDTTNNLLFIKTKHIVLNNLDSNSTNWFWENFTRMSEESFYSATLNITTPSSPIITEIRTVYGSPETHISNQFGQLFLYPNEPFSSERIDQIFYTKRADLITRDGWNYDANGGPIYVTTVSQTFLNNFYVANFWLSTNANCDPYTGGGNISLSANPQSILIYPTASETYPSKFYVNHNGGINTLSSPVATKSAQLKDYIIYSAPKEKVGNVGVTDINFTTYNMSTNTYVDSSSLDNDITLTFYTNFAIVFDYIIPLTNNNFIYFINITDQTNVASNQRNAYKYKLYICNVNNSGVVTILGMQTITAHSFGAGYTGMLTTLPYGENYNYDINIFRENTNYIWLTISYTQYDGATSKSKPILDVIKLDKAAHTFTLLNSLIVPVDVLDPTPGSTPSLATDSYYDFQHIVMSDNIIVGYLNAVDSVSNYKNSVTTSYIVNDPVTPDVFTITKQNSVNFTTDETTRRYVMSKVKISPTTILSVRPRSKNTLLNKNPTELSLDVWDTVDCNLTTGQLTFGHSVNVWNLSYITNLVASPTVPKKITPVSSNRYVQESFSPSSVANKFYGYILDGQLSLILYDSVNAPFFTIYQIFDFNDSSYSTKNTLSTSQPLALTPRKSTDSTAGVFGNVLLTPLNPTPTAQYQNREFFISDTIITNYNPLYNLYNPGIVCGASTQCQPPVPNPVAGSYQNSVTVSLTCATPSSTIHYTIDGSDPIISGLVYSTPLTFTTNTTLRAYATAPGFTASTAISAVYTVYTLQVDPVAFTPVAGTYSSSQNVILSTTTPGATIVYTLDGSNPIIGISPMYSGPINISTNTTIKAKAYKTTYIDSIVTTSSYVIQQTCAPVTFSPIFGTYTSPVNVQMSTTTSGATIRYTLDNTNPTSTIGTIYSSPINLSVNGTYTFTAIAYKSGFLDSTITSSTYTINIPPPPPPSSPPTIITCSDVKNVYAEMKSNGLYFKITMNYAQGLCVFVKELNTQEILSTYVQNDLKLIHESFIPLTTRNYQLHITSVE